MSDRWDEFDDAVRMLAVLSARLRTQGYEALSDRMLDATKSVKSVAMELDAAAPIDRSLISESLWDRLREKIVERATLTHRQFTWLLKHAGWPTTRLTTVNEVLRRFEAEGLVSVVRDDADRPTGIEVLHDERSQPAATG